MFSSNIPLSATRVFWLIGRWGDDVHIDFAQFGILRKLASSATWPFLIRSATKEIARIMLEKTGHSHDNKYQAVTGFYRVPWEEAARILCSLFSVQPSGWSPANGRLSGGRAQHKWP